jgi:hypothetical protein
VPTLSARNYQRAYYLHNQKAIKERVKRYQQENRAKVAAAKKEYRKVHLTDERRRQQAYYRDHAEQIKARVRAYQTKNRDKIRAAKRKKRPHINAVQRARLQKNSNRLNARSREKRRRENRARFGIDDRRRTNKSADQRRAEARQRGRKWIERHREEWRLQQRTNASKRRAKKRGTSIGTDRKAYAAFIRHVATAKRLRCYWCGKVTARKRRHVDHVIAIVNGGADDVHNLCCACSKCNLRKNRRSPEEFSGQHVIVFRT